MATHSSILAWKIPWIEKPGGLQSLMSQRIRHDWAHTHVTSPRINKTDALAGNFLGPDSKVKSATKSSGGYSWHLKSSGDHREEEGEKRGRDKGRKRERNTEKRGWMWWLQEKITEL